MDGTYRAKDATTESTDRQPSKFTFESNVTSDYASTNYDILIKQLSDMIDNLFLLDLVWQDVRRTVVKAGIYTDVQQAIPQGCSFPTLMGSDSLNSLAEAMKQTARFLARFMDDWVVLAPTRW